LADIDAIEMDGATGQTFKAHDGTKRRGLIGGIGVDQRDNVASREGKRNIAQRLVFCRNAPP
jgi:hypothetical protein